MARRGLLLILSSPSGAGKSTLFRAIAGIWPFGKGTVNQLQPLKNCGDPDGCGALYLSVGRWLTPNGDQIEGLGVKPDIELPMTYDEYVDQGDIQMFKAIDLLHGK